MTFCTDSDLLMLEPWIFRDAAFASQLLSSGTGAAAGTAFTRSAGSFVDDHAAAAGVLTLSGDLAGCYPIMAVVSATVLTISSFHESLFTDNPAAPSPVGTGGGIAFVVRTFAPQREIVSDLIRAAAGVGAGTRCPNAVVLISPQLRNAAVLGTFQLIYSALAAASAEPADLSHRADYYERLYRRALSRLRVEIDTNADGKADIARKLNVIEMVRV